MVIITLTNDNYFEDDIFMSVSQYKRFKRCQFGALQPCPNEKSSALLIGSYVDSYVEGTLDQFIDENPEIFTSNVTEVQKKAVVWLKNNWSNLYESELEEHCKKNGELKANVSDSKLVKSILESKDVLEDILEEFPDFEERQLKSEFTKAQEICDYIDSNERIKKYLSGEKQTIMTGTIMDVPFKIKMDSYSKGICISDLKIMRSVTNSSGEYIDFITSWGYDVQLACYQEIVRQNTGEQLPCYIVALTKESPINSVIIHIPQYILDSALYDVKENIRGFYKVKMGEQEAERCEKCKACIEHREVTPLISMADIVEGI